MLKNVENLFHLTDYNNMSNLYEFQQQYNMAQEFIKHRDEFYQSFTISRFSRAKDFIEAIELGKIKTVIWIGYDAIVHVADANTFEYKTIKCKNTKSNEDEDYSFYQVTSSYFRCVLDESRYAIKFGDILYVIRSNDFIDDSKLPHFNFSCDQNNVISSITYTEQFEKGPKYYDRITDVNFIFDVHTNELINVTHHTTEKFVRRMTSSEFCEWFD